MNVLIFMLTFLLYSFCSSAYSNQQNDYIAVPGLIDLRSTFSDGAHSIDDLAKIAYSRGFKVIFINDHDRIALSYGIPPFRNILRYKKEYPSIMTNGPEKYIDEIKRVSEKYPDMIIIPGCETSAYYYWTGSWLTGDLTLHDYDRRIIIINLTDANDYKLLPNLPNKFSFRYTRELLPGALIFILPLCIGIILLKWKGFSRFMGILIIIFSTMAIIDYNPFRSSLFSPYKRGSGIAPYQELINYVNDRGGLSFWNYPEQKSEIRTYGPINVMTPQYPHVLYESTDYTGFSAIYGEYTTVTAPGGEWDRVLNEYCIGKRDRPPWGISTADFHEEGRLNLVLGSFPTIFLVKEFTKNGILESIDNGRMYCSRGDGNVWPKLEYFHVSGKNGEKAFMGDILTIDSPPLVKFRLSYNTGPSAAVKIHLIRGGELIQIFEGVTPMQIEYIDEKIPPGIKTYYRLMDEREHLVSNPIFVIYGPHIT